MRRAGLTAAILTALCAGGLLCAEAGDTILAQNDPKPPTARKTPPAKKDARPRASLAVTPEREAAVTTFVQRNHPELEDLLLYLKDSQPDEYERAVREIFRTTERLALIRERDRQQYDLEVAAWQAQSRVQLLAAKLQMDSSPELATQLREALRLQNEARLALLKHERQKTADRLARFDTDIARVERDREAIIERQFKLLTAGGSNSGPDKRPAKLNTKTSSKPTKKKS